MIRHFLRGIAAKDRVVRFRCVQFIANIVNTLQEIEDDLYEDLKYNLSKRIYDKEPNVRYYAALALTKMQDDPNEVSDDSFSVTSLLLQTLQHDSSAEVRRTILLNLSKTSATRRGLLERAMDTNPTNRRFVYSRVMEEIGDFRQLSIHHREKLLQWGLKDRDVSVRTAATKMFLEQWLKSSDNNIQEFLERLDVINSTIAQTAMSVFFANRKDALDAFDFTDELWQSLTPETVFLIRTFNDYCIKEKLTLKLEEKLPELTKLGFFIELYINRLDKDPENIDLQFIAEQLLIIAETYDYADEVGRRKILATLRDFATNKNLSDSVINKFVPIIRKLSVKESDFSQVIVELISDIKDQCEEELENLEPDSDDRIFLENTCIIRCLVLAQSMLELIILPLESNQYLTAFLDTLIVPSIRSHYAEVREHGLKCLGLCCLVSKKLAHENLLLFARCFTQGHDQLKELALQAITDILMIHGKQVLGLDSSEINENTIYKLYCRALQDGDAPEIQYLSAVSLCKLLLNGIFDEPELMKACVLEYFGFDSSFNSKMRQILNYCIPVFCFSSAEKQKIMASIVVDSLRKLCDLYEQLEEDEEMLSPSLILQQMIDWTDPNRVVTAVNGELQQGSGDDKIHTDLAIEMLERTEKTYSKVERKALCLGLTKLKLVPRAGIKKLTIMKEMAKSLLDENIVTEGASKNLILKFIKEVENLLKKAETENITQSPDLSLEKQDEVDEEPTQADDYPELDEKENALPSLKEEDEDDGTNKDTEEAGDADEKDTRDTEMGDPETPQKAAKPTEKYVHEFDYSRKRIKSVLRPGSKDKNSKKTPRKTAAGGRRQGSTDDETSESEYDVNTDSEGAINVARKDKGSEEKMEAPISKTRTRRAAVKAPVVDESESEDDLEAESQSEDESGSGSGSEAELESGSDASE